MGGKYRRKILYGFLCARHCANHFLVYCHKNSMKLFSISVMIREWRLSKALFLKFIQLVSDRGGILTQVCLTPNYVLILLNQIIPICEYCLLFYSHSFKSPWGSHKKTCHIFVLKFLRRASITLSPLLWECHV